MTVDVSVQRIIRRPLAEVATFAADPTRAPLWYANIRSVEWRTPPPMTEGSRFAFVAHFLGRRLSYDYEIVAHVPGERLVMQTDGKPFPMRTTYTWEHAGPHATRMTLRNTGEPTGFAALGAGMLRAAMRKATTRDLERLAELLERS